MALPYSVLALDTAGRLDRELAAVANYLDDPAGLFARDARSAFLLHSIQTVAVTVRLLRQHVLDAIARSTDAAIDIHERAVRARARILMRALPVLKRREHEVAASALVGRFRRLHDVCTFLVDEVSEIYARWNEQRETAWQLDPSIRWAFRYAAVDDAEIAFERLGRDTALATFLRVGAANETEPVSTACREIAATVGLALSTLSDDSADDVPTVRSERAS